MSRRWEVHLEAGPVVYVYASTKQRAIARIVNDSGRTKEEIVRITQVGHSGDGWPHCRVEIDVAPAMAKGRRE